MSIRSKSENRKKQRAASRQARMGRHHGGIDPPNPNETKTIILEIEVKIPTYVVNWSRHQVYGLEGDEEHDAIMQACVNKINNKPLRDFTITGWGFKEKDDE